VFDFLGLVAAFDAAGQPSNFNVANNLANHHLWGSDTEAIGGAIAYEYAKNNSIGALSYDQMRSILGASEFAISAQPISTSGLMSLSSPEEGGTLLAVSAPSTSRETSEVSTGGAVDVEEATPVLSLADRAVHAGSQEGVVPPRPTLAPDRLEAPGSLLSLRFSESIGSSSEQGRHIGMKSTPDQGDVDNGSDRSSPDRSDAVRSAAASTGLNTPLGSGEVDAILSERLSTIPNYHFEALAEFLEAEANKKNRLLSAEQIAGSWSRVRSYSQELGMSSSAEDSDGSALMGFQIGVDNSFAATHMGAPVRPTIGLNDSAAANLKQLEGIKGAMPVLG
jgi:hypothetical protein